MFCGELVIQSFVYVGNLYWDIFGLFQDIMCFVLPIMMSAFCNSVYLNVHACGANFRHTRIGMRIHCKGPL